MANDIYNTQTAIELAEISLEVARDAVHHAEAALADAHCEHDVTEAVLADSEGKNDDTVVEELVYEGNFDYSLAEAIVRFERHDWQTSSDVRDMTVAELRETCASGSTRVQGLVAAEQERRARRHMELVAYA